MINVLNSGNIIIKLKTDGGYETFNIGASTHPDSEVVLRYIKNHPKLSIVEEQPVVAIEPKAPEVRKKKRRRKSKPVTEESE